MHTHGTAVLDRPAEATMLAAPLPSASVPGTGTSGSESARSTINAAELTTEYDAVRSLGYGELAVALRASGACPSSFRSATTAQLMEWAAQGLALLGIDRIRHYARRTRHLNLRPHLSAEDRAEYAHMWPCDRKAVQSCHDAAFGLAFTG